MAPFKKSTKLYLDIFEVKLDFFASKSLKLSLNEGFPATQELYSFKSSKK